MNWQKLVKDGKAEMVCGTLYSSAHVELGRTVNGNFVVTGEDLPESVRPLVPAPVIDPIVVPEPTPLEQAIADATAVVPVIDRVVPTAAAAAADLLAD